MSMILTGPLLLALEFRTIFNQDTIKNLNLHQKVKTELFSLELQSHDAKTRNQ
jgi:hypothetical protein